MKHIIHLAALSALLCPLFGCNGLGGKAAPKLTIQAYTFRNDTLFGAIDKTAEVGVNYIEAFGWQKVSDEYDMKLVDATPEARQAVKAKLAEAGVTMINCYMQLKGDEAAIRRGFAFARDMGIDTIVAEPPPEQLAMMDELTREYEVNLAIHNHKRLPDKPEYVYWNPQSLLALIADLNPRVGASPDTGHYMRSGVDPVEALETLEPRLISVHLKDVKELAPDAEDAVWGRGVGHIDAQIEELKRQKFGGTVVIEYESNPADNVAEVRQCVEYFNNAMK